METNLSKDALTKLLSEIESVDPGTMQPPAPFGKNDEKICILEDSYLRQLFILGMMYQRQQEEAELQAKWDQDENTKGLASKYEHISDTLRMMFWLLVREKYNIWNGSIGVRKEWQLVYNKENNNDPSVILKNILGLG